MPLNVSYTYLLLLFALDDGLFHDANVACTISRLLLCCGHRIPDEPFVARRIDAYRIGSYDATSDDVDRRDGPDRKKGPVAASRPVTSGRSNRYGRRPTPWPDANPDPKSMYRLLARHRASGTQSSEEGDIPERLPAPRKRLSKSKPGRLQSRSDLNRRSPSTSSAVTRP